MIEKICLICREKFYSYDSEIKRGGGKFCSHSCYIKNRINRIFKNCVICNKEFLTKPSLIKIGKGKLCSVNCSRAWLSKIKKGIRPIQFNQTNRIPWNKGKIGSQIAWNKGTKGLCKSTSGSWKKGNVPWNKNKDFLKGDLNPNWQGGLTSQDYPWDFNEDLKDRIRKRDRYTCKNCGMTEEEHLVVYGRILNVHHIDYIKENIGEINLITLCTPCHIRSNYNRCYWKEKLTECLIMFPMVKG